MRIEMSFATCIGVAIECILFENCEQPVYTRMTACQMIFAMSYYAHGTKYRHDKLTQNGSGVVKIPKHTTLTIGLLPPNLTRRTKV